RKKPLTIRPSSSSRRCSGTTPTRPGRASRGTRHPRVWGLSYDDAGRHVRRPAHRIMNRLLRRLRGSIGIGLTWSAGWALLGALLTAVLRVLRPEDVDPGENELIAAAVFGMAGFLCGAAFGVVLAIAERRRAL